MTTWNKTNTKVTLAFSSLVIFIAVTAAFLGFTGFKTVNVNAMMLFFVAVGAIVFIVGFIGGLLNKRQEAWVKTKKTGLMLIGASIAYILFELRFPIV